MMTSQGKGGFTLVEVVLALGIFGFCILAILGLLGGLLTDSRESWMETRSAQIARQIMQDLTPNSSVTDTNQTTRASASTGMLVLPAGPVTVPLLPASAQTNTAYYTAEGEVVEQSSADALFRADVSVSPLAPDGSNGTLPVRQMSQIQIDVRPINQTNARPFRFISRLTPQYETP